MHSEFSTKIREQDNNANNTPNIQLRKKRSGQYKGIKSEVFR